MMDPEIYFRGISKDPAGAGRERRELPRFTVERITGGCVVYRVEWTASRQPARAGESDPRPR
jgi:hypothetical protein